MFFTNMCAKWSLFLVLLSAFTSNDGAKILGVFPFFAPSHYFLGSALMKGLAEAGHDVTMISPFSEKNPPKNGTWREIVTDDVIEKIKSMFSKFDMFKQNHNVFNTLLLLNTMGNFVTDETMGNRGVQELIKSNEKFDVVIVSQFCNDAMKVFATHFNAHLILFSNVAANSWFNHLVGNPSLPSFLPEVLLDLPSQMSFIQRVQNSLFKLLNTLYFNLYFYPKQNEYIQKHLPNPVDIHDVLYNVSLVLINSHESIFTAQPRVPCMVEIGGFHIQPPKKLPKDLQKFLDDAKEGVIYFSLGSNLLSNNLPIEKREALLKAFAKRKEKVLWKWEGDTLPGQPNNVKLGKWLPQQDILAHPNVRLFITHGGLLSTTETVYHGVPIIAIPIAGDQKMNANNAARAGYGIVLPFGDLSEDKLSGLIDEIISNPKYTDNAKERSRIMKDRQVKPLDNAVYWVEYVIRHNGAKHLKVQYLGLTWYQLYLLDVIGFILGVILVTVIIIKKLCSYVCGRRQNGHKLKTN